MIILLSGKLEKEMPYIDSRGEAMIPPRAFVLFIPSPVGCHSSSPEGNEGSGVGEGSGVDSEIGVGSGVGSGVSSGVGSGVDIGSSAKSNAETGIDAGDTPP